MYYIVFIVIAIISFIFYFLNSKNYLVSLPVVDQGLRNEEYNAVFQTGLVSQSDEIEGPVPTDTSMYTSRSTKFLYSNDKKNIEPKSELLEVNPVHYLSVPAYTDLQNSMEERKSLPVPTAIKI